MLGTSIYSEITSSRWRDDRRAARRADHHALNLAADLGRLEAAGPRTKVDAPVNHQSHGKQPHPLSFVAPSRLSAKLGKLDHPRWCIRFVDMILQLLVGRHCSLALGP